MIFEGSEVNKDLTFKAK